MLQHVLLVSLLKYVTRGPNEQNDLKGGSGPTFTQFIYP